MRVHAISIAIAAALLSNTVISLYYRTQLAQAQTEIAIEREQHAIRLKSLSEATIAAQQKAYTDYQEAVIKIENLDAQLTKECLVHETDNRNYGLALANGTERLRIALANHPSHHNSLPSLPKTTRTPSVGNAPACYANLDPTIAQRLLRIAADADYEISKLKVLQGYICAIRPGTVGCVKALEQ